MEPDIQLKLLVGSDLHNDSAALDWFCNLAEEHTPDVVVFLGDFITHEPISFLKETLIDLRDLADHILVIPGNHDPRQALVEIDILAFDGLKHLHKQSAFIGGLSFAGLGGSVTTPKGLGELEYPDEGFAELLASQVPADVWVLHCPLYGILDQNTPGIMFGSKSLLELFDTQTDPPRLVLSGHAHDGVGVEVQGQTHFVNPGSLMNRSAAIVEITADAIDVRHISG